MNLLLLCVVLILWYMLFRYKRRRLYELAACIPEPPLRIPFFGILQLSIRLGDGILSQIKIYSLFALNNGGVVKLWVGPYLFLGLTNKNDIEFLLKNYLEKSHISWPLRKIIGDAGIFAPVSIWIRRRKLIVPAFSPKIMTSFMDILINESDELAEQFLRDKRVGRGPFKAWPYISAYSLVSVCETALGIKASTLRNSKNKFQETVVILLSTTTHRIFRVWLWPDCIFKWTKLFPKFMESLYYLYNLTDEIIQMKRKELKDCDYQLTEYDNSQSNVQGPRKVKCFLEHLISLSINDGITDVELKEEVLTFLMAGTDTSSVAVCNTLKLLAKYPKIQEKLYKEIMEVLEDPCRSLKKEDLLKLQYLERVIKESLRLFPPVPIIARKVYSEVSLPSGRIIPAGTDLVISIWGANRDPEDWGPDAECFDPDRFLPGRKTGLYIPFSYGPRNCVGYQFAMMTIKMAVTAIVRRYKIVSEEEPGRIPNMECTYSIMMKARDDWEIGLEMR